MSSHKMLLTLMFAGTILAVVAASEVNQPDLYDKRNTKNEVSANKRPFFVGSRYGRSQLYDENNKAVRQVNVVPRNDKFFLGSRYGKRSEEQPPDTNAQYASENLNVMACTYTGVKNLYRCYSGNENSNEDRSGWQ